MRVMVLIRADVTGAGAGPNRRLAAEMGQFNEALVKAGVLLAAEGLDPGSECVRVQFAGGARTIVNGPPTERRGPIAGMWLWQVRSLDEAIEWVKRFPSPREAEVEIDIHHVLEPEEPGDEIAAVVPVHEGRMHQQRPTG